MYITKNLFPRNFFLDQISNLFIMAKEYMYNYNEFKDWILMELLLES